MFSTLQAQDTGSQAPHSPSFLDGIGGLFPFILIFLIFYFLLIRPQTKRQKELDKKRKALQKGDKFITGGGLVATVIQVKDENTITAEISKDVRVEVLKSTIMNVLTSKAEKNTSKKK